MSDLLLAGWRCDARALPSASFAWRWGFHNPAANPLTTRFNQKQQLKHTMDNIKDVSSIIEGQQSLGMDTKGGISIEVSGGQTLSPDPIMHQLAAQAVQLNKYLQQELPVTHQ